MKLIKNYYILILLIIIVLTILIVNISYTFKEVTCTYDIKEDNYILNIDIKLSFNKTVITKKYLSDNVEILNSELQLNKDYKTKLENNTLLAIKKLDKPIKDINSLKKQGFICR